MEENNTNTPPVKKKRGNPNLTRGHKNEHINKTNNPMAEETNTTTEEKEVKSEETSEKSTTTELPKDLFDDKIKEPFLPLEEPVIDRGYTNISNDAANASQQQASSSAGNASQQSQPGTTTPPVTTAPITPEEMNQQAAQTVNLMLKGYEKLHALGRYMGKIDQQELMTLHVKGKIDLEAPLPLGNKTIQVKDFFNEYNQGIDENITVSDDFIKEITPPLTRICIKNKLFLSDELFVGMILAEDAATKISILLGLKKSAKLVLEAVMQMKSANKTTNNTSSSTEDTSSADAWREPEVTEATTVE